MTRKRLTPEQRRMRDVVKRMKRYVRTYDKQAAYMDYTDDTFIYDMLYGIGIALDPKGFQYAQGFAKFKDKLLLEYGKERVWTELNR